MNPLTEECIAWVKNKFASVGATDACIGISGGKDSTIVAAICVAALGKEHVHGVLMPQGVQHDIDDSIRVCELLGIEFDNLNIESACNALMEIYPAAKDAVVAKTNLPPRVRMTLLHLVAQTHGWLVANTCNLSEDTVGYATIFGDKAGAFAPIAQLTTSEVCSIGIDLGLPPNFVFKTPADGLQDKTDEDNLGFTYNEVNDLIRNGIMGPHYEQIMEKYRKNKFKDEMIHIDCFRHPCFRNRIEEHEKFGIPFKNEV